MHSYRLTRRGKFVLTMFVMMLSLASSLFIKDIAIASARYEITIQNPVYLSNVDSSVQSVSFFSSELKRLKNNDNEILLASADENLKISKEIEKEKEKEILSVNVEDISSYEGKVAFLTFDDGPSHNVTPLILETLERYNIYATFFVLGNMCEKNGYMLNKIRDRGHSIGVHSYTHENNKFLKSRESFISEIKMSEDAIKKWLGDDFTTRLFRFPGGGFEPYKKQYMSDLHDLGYVSVDWNALTGDSEYVNPEAGKLMDRLKATIINKDRIIVLMHDSDAKQVSAEILPDVIEHLKAEGYEFAVLK